MIYKTISLVKSFIHQRIERWLSRRVPSNTKHKLTRSNIFIMPSKFGLAYLFFVFLLFLLGTNYQNNIILLVCYLLASLFVSVMLHSFYNFSQLIFESSALQYGFAKQRILFPLIINSNKVRFDINASFSQQNHQLDKLSLNQCDVGCNELMLPFIASQRGLIDLGRVRVSSEYPFGMFTTWAMLDFSHQAVVFPKPKRVNTNQYKLSSENMDELGGYHVNPQVGIDDFSELKNYVLGEPQSRIAWKQFARGQGLFSKHYQSQQGQLLWLKLSDMPSHNLETKLRFLAFLVVENTKNNQTFGLSLREFSTDELTKVDIAPDFGDYHQKQCLIALANF